MSFLRHVGKHGDRKVAVIFREVPGEPHMCLVTYPEVLNQHIHDPLMKCIESDIGQNSKNLADALNRTHTKDGQIILQKLHAEGMLKKVNTEQVVMTPAPNIKIKLHELNTILDEMEQGEAAVKKLAEMDASMGLQDPIDVAKRMRGDSTVNPAPTGVKSSGDALGDESLAGNLLAQAERMEREAKGLLAESERLIAEARALNPALMPAVKVTKPAKTKTSTASKAKKVNVS
jgi:hypothetical protein